jgi:AcrR family transcriptional regulator
MARKRASPAASFQSRKLPRQRRSRATVEALVEAAARLLAERGYHGATTREIAARAGVSVGSLYQYFPSRDALVTAVLERHVAHVLETTGSLFRRLEQAPLQELIRRLVTAVLELHEQDQALHAILIEQLPRADRTAIFRKIDRVLAAQLGAFLERRPELPRVDPVRSIAVLERACLPLIHGRAQGHEAPLARRIDDLVQLIVGYLGAAGRA